MNFTTLPAVADIRAYINGISVGALKSFCEQCLQEVTLLRQLGSSENLAYNRNGRQYVVELRYLLPLGCELVEAPSDPVGLDIFTLEIALPKRTLRFGGCVCQSVKTSCDVGGSLVCELQILARDRQCIDEMG